MPGGGWKLRVAEWYRATQDAFHMPFLSVLRVMETGQPLSSAVGRSLAELNEEDRGTITYDMIRNTAATAFIGM
jgi:hypothetical protein